jgi:hypothetical protein
LLERRQEYKIKATCPFMIHLARNFQLLKEQQDGFDFLAKKKKIVLTCSLQLDEILQNMTFNSSLI